MFGKRENFKATIIKKIFFFRNVDVNGYTLFLQVKLNFIRRKEKCVVVIVGAPISYHAKNHALVLL